MSKRIIILKSKKRALNLKILAQRRERIRRRLEVTAKKLAAIAKEKEDVRRKLVITANHLAVTAKEKEIVRHKLVITAKHLAVAAKEKEDTRYKLVTTAKQLAATAKERESVRLRLVTTAKTLAVTAKEKEDVRRKLAMTAKNLSIKDKQLAATAKEKEIIRLRLVQTADDLERSSAKNEAMLGAIGDGLIAVDNDRKIMFLNKVAVDMIGWKTNNLIGKIITELPLQDEKGNFIPLNLRPTTLALKSDKRTEVTYFYVRPDKTRFPMSITVTPIKINNKTIGLIEVIRDITLEKEIDRAKSEFISLASHQLKTPPTAIKLLIE
ncbi:MAG TPA: PAS domain S-box protein, partial [Candidatus Paceibacterota bacterium]|nr:PAS domain S-box protein [Candidatus Paceibacterota bacterium]